MTFMQDIYSQACWNVLIQKYGTDILKNSRPLATEWSTDNAAALKVVRTGIFDETGNQLINEV